MAKSKFRSLNYRHEVVVESRNGRVRTTVRATDQIAVWSNKRQKGPTVRADGETHRFHNSQIVSRSVTI